MGSRRDRGSASAQGNSLASLPSASKRGRVRPTAIVKRDGSAVPFELSRITAAILKALHAVGTQDRALAAEMACVVLEHLERHSDQPTLGIEEVQDAVVHV